MDEPCVAICRQGFLTCQLSEMSHQVIRNGNIVQYFGTRTKRQNYGALWYFYRQSLAKAADKKTNP